MHRGWIPHGGVQITEEPTPLTFPDSQTYDRWAVLQYAGIVGGGFDGKNFGLYNMGTVDFDVADNVDYGTLGYQLNIVCNDESLFLPSESDLFELQFTRVGIRLSCLLRRSSLVAHERAASLKRVRRSCTETLPETIERTQWISCASSIIITTSSPLTSHH